MANGKKRKAAKGIRIQGTDRKHHGINRALPAITVYRAESLEPRLLLSSALVLQPQMTYADANGTVAIQAADINGDGAPDMVVANYDDYSVSVFLGNGNGLFQSP